MSSRSVRCTPSFFKPIVKSLTQMPPSPFTSRTWNSTLNLCSCSDPPHMSQWCDAWPESGCQRATCCRTVVFAFSEYAHPPSGSTPEGVSEDRHWQNICKGGINDPCWCISETFTLFQPHQSSEGASGHCWSCEEHVTCPSIWAGVLLKRKCYQELTHLQIFRGTRETTWDVLIISIEALPHLASKRFSACTWCRCSRVDKIGILSSQRLLSVKKPSGDPMLRYTQSPWNTFTKRFMWHKPLRVSSYSCI